jgi:hypothetical protein
VRLRSELMVLVQWDEQISLVVFGVVLTVVYGRLGSVGVALLLLALGYKRQRARRWEYTLEAAREEGRLDGQLASRGSDERMWFDYALKVRQHASSRRSRRTHASSRARKQALATLSSAHSPMGIDPH